MQPQATSHVYRSVLLKKADEQSGEFLAFLIYLPGLKF